MMNGKQKAQQNIEAFHAWTATQSDEDYKQIIFRGQLNRGEIAKATGVGKSALRQNPEIKRLLESLENELRAREILPPLTPASEHQEGELQLYDAEVSRRARNDQRAARLEQENIELKARVNELESRLARFGELSEALTEMGMMPR
ncbi:VPA1267 family protein [Marinobacter aromaticivorans]